MRKNVEISPIETKQIIKKILIKPYKYMSSSAIFVSSLYPGILNKAINAYCLSNFSIDCVSYTLQFRILIFSYF